MRWFWLIFLAFILWACAMEASRSAPRFAVPATLPVSCDTVRWYAAHFTQKHLQELADAAGFKITAGQRVAARKCLSRK
jgi:hypothetical protein